MAFCPHCTYWQRGNPRDLKVNTCPNCSGRLGGVPGFGTAYSSLRQLPKALGGAILGLGCVAALLSPMILLPVLLRSPGPGFVVVLILVILGMILRLHLSQPKQKGTLDLSVDLQNQQSTLECQISTLKSLAAEENRLSERSQKRATLLEATILNRQRKLALLAAQLWSRDVQLWANRVEGFVAEKLEIQDAFQGQNRLAQLQELSNCGKALKIVATEPLRATTLGQQGLKTVALYLNRMEELVEYIRDARVLATVGEGPEMPADFEPESELAWASPGLPTCEEHVKDVLHVEDEFVKLNTEMRLLRDGVKFSNEA